MAKVGITKALSSFFNVDGGTGSLGGFHTTKDGTTHELAYGRSSKRSLPEFRDELKSLTDSEKRELALAVCVATGDTLE